jgi:hypothetical protein
MPVVTSGSSRSGKSTRTRTRCYALAGNRSERCTAAPRSSRRTQPTQLCRAYGKPRDFFCIAFTGLLCHARYGGEPALDTAHARSSRLDTSARRGTCRAASPRGAGASRCQRPTYGARRRTGTPACTRDSRTFPASAHRARSFECQAGARVVYGELFAMPPRSRPYVAKPQACRTSRRPSPRGAVLHSSTLIVRSPRDAKGPAICGGAFERRDEWSAYSVRTRVGRLTRADAGPSDSPSGTRLKPPS